MTRAALLGPRREAGIFPWALLGAVVFWLALLLAWGARFAVHPVGSIAPPPVDARLVELPPAPVPPTVAKPQPQKVRPKPLPKVKKSPIARPVRHKPKPKPVPKPAVKSAARPKPAAKAVPTQPQATVNRDVMGARAVYNPLPKIPDDLRRAAMDEVAVARLHIHTDGTVTVELLRPTDNPRVNRIILDALRTWMFYPALDKGRPVESVQQIRIRLSVGD